MVGCISIFAHTTQIVIFFLNPLNTQYIYILTYTYMCVSARFHPIPPSAPMGLPLSLLEESERLAVSKGEGKLEPPQLEVQLNPGRWDFAGKRQEDFF